MSAKCLRVVCWAAVAVLAVGLPAGCGRERFTRVSYETVFVGQTADGVARALGEPTLREYDRWVYVHDDPPYYRGEIHFGFGDSPAGGEPQKVVVDKKWSTSRPADELRE